MRFFKENSESIIKLIINQIGIAIFAFFLYTAAGAIKSEVGGASLLINVLISVFSILFYFVLIYNVMWEIGAKDKIRIDGKRMERKPEKGILMGIYANIPNFIIMGIALLLILLYILTGAEVLKTIFGVLNAIFRIFVSMYLGALMGISAPFGVGTDIYYLVQTVGFIVFSLVSALVIHISYLMGLNDLRIFKTSKPPKNP